MAGCYILSCIHAFGLPATVTLGNLVQAYDGTPKTPSVTTDPPGLNVTWRFTDPAAGAPQPVTETVYQNTPGSLDLSYPSISFSAQQTWGYGDYVGLAGTARNLESVDAVMVSWAKAENYPEQAAANPSGWYHPVTLTVYDMNASGVLAFRGEVTRTIFVPWRPLTLPDGSLYPHNGTAFMAHFDFPPGLVLAEQAMFLISYNTQSSGFTPIGSPGPYNELNVAVGGSAMTGTDVIPGKVLWVLSSAWSYPTKAGAPRFIVKANHIPETGTSQPPVNAGSWLATAKINDPNYQGEASANFTITPATASLTFGNLSATYDGSQKPVSVVTDPPGLAVSLTYDGSASVPTHAGSYAVVATINDPNHTGTASSTLVIGKATAGITLGSLTATYDGNAKSASAATTPAGLNVNFTYNGSTTSPTHAGSYHVVATIDDANYTGMATGTLEIGKAPAAITLGALAASYDGNPKPASATTTPAGLAVSLTYDGSATAPKNAGTYAVLATINDMNFAGTASETLVIGKATAGIILGSLAAIYDGNAKSASATTTPAGLNVNFTYNGSATSPTNSGSYHVVATIDDMNHAGMATGTLEIGKAPAAITLGALATTYDGTPKPASATTTPAGLSVNLTYDGSATAPTNAGTYSVVATIQDTNYMGTASGNRVIDKAMATVILGDLTAIYDGNPKAASASTMPPGLAVSLTYNDSSAAPVAVGQYSVRAVLIDPNYFGSAIGEFRVGHNLESWLAPWVQAGRIAPTAVGWNDDPDFDQIGNLLEYAFALDPSTATHGLPARGMPLVEYGNGALSIVYRKNLAAMDLVFQVESTARPDGPAAWSPATTVETLLATENSVQTLRATLVPDGGEAHRFIRLRVERP